MHWHWHSFSWPLAPASNDGKIITFLPRCEGSRYRRLHFVGRLLVVITSFCPSCEAAFKASSHDSQMLVTATYSQQMTEVISSTSSFDQLNWRRRMLHFCRQKPSAQISQDTVYLTTILKNRNDFFFVMILINVLDKKLEGFCIGLTCFQLTACASVEWRKNNNYFT